jgi:AAA ATPase-like protein
MTGELNHEFGQLVRSRFDAEGIPLDELLTRQYPEETVIVVHVPEGYLQRAAEVGNELDQELQAKGFQGFVTIRRSAAKPVPSAQPFRSSAGVADERVGDLIELISSRARTSEAQPSLHYVLDAAANLARVRSPRHSLIFGRRGAGKTALMLEAKRQIADDGQLVVWLNLQTYRRESMQRVLLWVASKIVDALLASLRVDQRQRHLYGGASSLRAQLEALLGMSEVSAVEVDRLVPQIQSVIQRFCESTSKRLYVFLDDVHYIARDNQPELLDVLHSCVRDADAWLKIAAIRHFAKWYRISPPTGLQAGQDADMIDLDITLQEPTRAKQFLERVLAGFANHVLIPKLSALFSYEALDRLVLASGAVPRDYLVLAAGALSHARSRGRGRVVGKQDVARSAGDIAQAKMAELEEDATSAAGAAQQMIQGLQRIRAFCLEDRRYTFFQVDFKDKETKVEEYSLLQSLMDVRLIHIVNPSVSDTHKSGERSEAYMLDLSQFSGERLKKYLHVLDLEEGHVVLKETGTTKRPRVGDTPRRLITILRSAPHFELSSLAEFVQVS